MKIYGIFTLVHQKQKDMDTIKLIVLQEIQLDTTTFTVVKKEKFPVYHKITHTYIV